MPNNLDILLNATAGLIKKRNLKTLDKRYDAKSFGDALVIIESRFIRIMIIFDRGQLLAEVGASSKSASKPESYIDLVAALNQIPNAIRKNNSVWNDPEELISALDTNFEELEKLVSK